VRTETRAWTRCGRSGKREDHSVAAFACVFNSSRYDKARQIKETQDTYCEHALAGQWDRLAGNSFPEDLQWEPLVAILRGQVKVTLLDAKGAC
jgi:hypothetical protein